MNVLEYITVLYASELSPVHVCDRFLTVHGIENSLVIQIIFHLKNHSYELIIIELTTNSSRTLKHMLQTCLLSNSKI